MKKILMLTSLFYVLSLSIFAQNSVIQDSLKSINNDYVLEFYKRLLSENDEIEYGWMCQSIVPVVPKEREALLALITLQRFDLIKTLLNAPKIETQLYAIDALIYQRIKADEFIGKEINDHIIRLKSSNYEVKNCPDFIGDLWSFPITTSTVFYSMTHNERVANLEYLLNEPLKNSTKSMFDKLEIPNVSGDY